MILINGKKIRDEIMAEIKKETELLPFQPVFCDVLVGEDKVSKQYVEMKKRYAEDIGFLFHEAKFSESIDTKELIKEIKKINQLENMCGIIVQLPLPLHIDKRTVLDAIKPELDVDCLGSIASERFYGGNSSAVPPTGLACLAVLDSLDLNLENKKIVILGQGELVGKPVTALLRFRNLNVETIDSKTENKFEIIKSANVIISGIGQGKFITGEMVKDGVVIIDAGTSEENSSIVGDVDFESVKDKASFISPVPGGVGPVTIAMLFKNVLEVAKKEIHLTPNPSPYKGEGKYRDIIKAILFDLDGLVISASKPFSKVFSERENIPYEKILEFFEKDFRECSFGKADLKEKIYPYLIKWNYKGTVEDLLKFWFENASEVDKEVVKIINILRSKSVRCYLSTRQEKYREDYVWNKMNLKNNFDGIFCTCDIGYDKWQKEYWEYVSEKLNLKPEEIMFFCDSQKNVDSASFYGIKAYLYGGISLLREKLHDFIKK